MHLDTVRITLFFYTFDAWNISGNYELPFFYRVYSYYEFPYPLNRTASWFDTTNIICGINGIQFTDNFMEYSTSFVGRAVDFHSTVSSIPELFYWSWSDCIIAGSQMCPETHPYFDTNTYLCYDSCPGANNQTYVCCPSNCDNCLLTNACNVCSSGYFKRLDNLCYSFCLPNTYPNFATKTCDSCPPGCATCTSLNACQTCSSLNYLIPGSVCVEKCPNGYYPEELSSTCA